MGMRLPGLSTSLPFQRRATGGVPPPTPPDPPVTSAATNLTDVSFSANWSASVGATGYKLYVYQTDGTTPVVGFNGLDVLNVTTYSVTGLVPYTNYKWDVKAYNAGGDSAESSPQESTTTWTAEAQAYFAILSVTASNQYKTAYNNMLVSYKTNASLDLHVNNFSTVCDRLAVLAGVNADNSLKDVVSLTTMSRVVLTGAAWTEKEGYTGNGVNGLIQWNYNPSTDAVAVNSNDFLALVFVHHWNGADNYGLLGTGDSSNYLYIECTAPTSDASLYTVGNSVLLANSQVVGANTGKTTAVVGVSRVADVANVTASSNAMEFPKAQIDAGFSNGNMSFFMGFPGDIGKSTIYGGIMIRRSACTPAQATAIMQQYLLDIA